jgi:methyltransferase (TIGR00027 family)
MDATKGSLTAVVTAFIRAYHATGDGPKVFDDFMARELFTEEERRLIGSNLAQCLPLFDPELAKAGPDEDTALDVVMRQQMSTVLCRSRYAEDCLEEAVAGGAAQYVILGAGMETYALRRPDMAGRLTVFEVDHPATQAFKKSRFAERGWETPGHLRFVPFDFTEETLAEALGQADYARQRESFFSLLGVSYYLPLENLQHTLRTIAATAPPGSALVFDYFDADAFIPEKADRRMRAIQTLVRNTGEPMHTGLAPETLTGMLRDAGFALREDLGPADLDRRYFAGRTDGLHAYDHVHLVRAEVR